MPPDYTASNMTMTRLVPTLLVVASLLVSPSVVDARLGARPPAFTLPAVVGGPTQGQFRLQEALDQHKPIIISFWATWCGPCRQELPFLETMYQRYREQGLTVVAISMDDTSTITQTGPAARRLGITFPVLSDLDTRVQGQLNPRRAAPMSIWVNKRGQIVWEREGFALAEREVLQENIRKLVAGEM